MDLYVQIFYIQLQRMEDKHSVKWTIITQYNFFMAKKYIFVWQCLEAGLLGCVAMAMEPSVVQFDSYSLDTHISNWRYEHSPVQINKSVGLFKKKKSRL